MFIKIQVARGKHSHEVKPTIDCCFIQELEIGVALINDRWTLFGKWYFADITQRPISPWSHVTLESYVNLLIVKGDRPSLE